MGIYDFVVKDYQDKDISLSQYKGSILLIVNTATHCGFTPQYNDLQKLYDKYKDKNFVILDFPCNQFLGQAPETDKLICEFRETNYSITFPQFKKINVNGKNADPLYNYLKTIFKGRIKWNFSKFLVDREGNVINRYGSTVKPFEIEEDILKIIG
jgi:glutathione peroxidase